MTALEDKVKELKSKEVDDLTKLLKAREVDITTENRGITMVTRVKDSSYKDLSEWKTELENIKAIMRAANPSSLSLYLSSKLDGSEIRESELLQKQLSNADTALSSMKNELSTFISTSDKAFTHTYLLPQIPLKDQESLFGLSKSLDVIPINASNTILVNLKSQYNEVDRLAISYAKLTKYLNENNMGFLLTNELASIQADLAHLMPATMQALDEKLRAYNQLLKDAERQEAQDRKTDAIESYNKALEIINSPEVKKKISTIKDSILGI